MPIARGWRSGSAMRCARAPARMRRSSSAGSRSCARSRSAGRPRSRPRKAAGRVFRFTKLQIGMPCPDFESVDADGKAFKLSDYEGKVTVVDFWGFW